MNVSLPLIAGAWIFFAVCWSASRTVQGKRGSPTVGQPLPGWACAVTLGAAVVLYARAKGWL